MLLKTYLASTCIAQFASANRVIMPCVQCTSSMYLSVESNETYPLRYIHTFIYTRSFISLLIFNHVNAKNTSFKRSNDFRFVAIDAAFYPG